MSILHHGEVKPCLELTRANDKKRMKASRVIKVKRVKFRSSSLNRLVQKKKYDYKDKRGAKVSPVHYSTFVISNSIERRRLFMPDTIPELQLQKIAKEVYASILLSLLNARPLTCFVVKPKEDSTLASVTDVYLEKLGSTELCMFSETVSMLVGSVEYLLKRATSCHQLLNDVDLLAVLSLWHEMNEVLIAPGGNNNNNQLTEQYETGTTPPQQVTSVQCCTILVDYLLAQPFVPPTIWQSSLVNLLGSLQHQKNLFVDYDKLLAVFVKFFVSSNMAASGLVSRIVGALLSEERRLVSSTVEGRLSGDCLLLEVLITALQRR